MASSALMLMGCATYLVGRPEAYDKLLVAVRAFDQEGNLLASTGGLHFGGEAPITGEVAVGKA